MTRGPVRTVVIIILSDGDGRILLQQRSDDASYMPGRWAYFGGGLKQGETPEQGLARETREELGYTPVRPVCILEQDFDLNGLPAHMFVFLEYVKGEKETLQLLEGKGWGWFNEKEIDALHMLPRDERIAQIAFCRIKTSICES